MSGTVTNQLVRIHADGSGFTVLRKFPAASHHDGGRIMFGPDGKLYVVIGDNDYPDRAQNLASMAGKMLRLNPDGTVPSNNPRAGSPIIAYGIRNSFGFTFDPQNGRLWETENGPDCNDEINLIPRFTLSNFGWGPSATCSSPPTAPRNTNQNGANPVAPKKYFATPPALTGAAFCHGCGLSSSGQLFFGDFNTGSDPPRHADLRPHRHRLAGAVLQPSGPRAVRRDPARRRPDLLQHGAEHLRAQTLTGCELAQNRQAHALNAALLVDGVEDRIASRSSKLSGAADDRDPVTGVRRKPNSAGELYPTATSHDERDLALPADRRHQCAGARGPTDLAPVTTQFPRRAE